MQVENVNYKHFMAPHDKRYSHVHRSNPMFVNHLYVGVPTWQPWLAALLAVGGQIIMLLCNEQINHHLPISLKAAFALSHILKTIGEGMLLFYLMKGMEVLQRNPRTAIISTISLLLMYHLVALFVVLKGYGYVSYTFMLTIYVAFLLMYSYLGLHISYWYYGKFPIAGYLLTSYLACSLVFNLFLGWTGTNLRADAISSLLAIAYFVYMRTRITNR